MLDVPRLYATGLGNVSVFDMKLPTFGNAFFLVHLSCHCFMLDVPRLYGYWIG
jgi:hypothetical protein